MEKKVYIIKTFVRLVIKHKTEKNIILSKLMKKEMKCNFIESDSEEEDEEEEEEIDEEFNEKVDLALSTNNNINSCDEFKYFSSIMMHIKENDPDIYNHLCEQFTSKNKNHLEDLLKTRNIKITYNQKEFTVPRKTVTIIRMNK